MSDHKTTLVPLATGLFRSPDLRAAGARVDLGLLGEALLYYDNIHLELDGPSSLVDLLQELQRTNSYDTFMDLVRGGIVTFVDFAFRATVVLPQQPGAAWAIWNVQDALQAEPASFERRYFSDRGVENCFPNARRRSAFFNAVRTHVIEFKSSAFDTAVTAAREDSSDPRRMALVVQAFMEDIYRARGKPRPPDVRAVITPLGPGRQNISWNYNAAEAQALLSPELQFRPEMALAAAADANRYALAASIVVLTE